MIESIINVKSVPNIKYIYNNYFNSIEPIGKGTLKPKGIF